MVAESSPPTRKVTVDIDAEIAALEAANDRDRRALVELEARIAGREENAAYLRGLLARAAESGLVAGILDAGSASDQPLEPVSLQPGQKTGATYVGPKLTQKFMTLSLLDEAPEEGLMAIEIIRRAGQRFTGAKTIERTSLSPLLAKMADVKGGAPLVIHHREENRWSIAPAGRDELKRLRGDAE